MRKNNLKGVFLEYEGHNRERQKNRIMSYAEIIRKGKRKEGKS